MPDLILRPGALRLVLAVNVMALHYSQRFGAPLYAPIDAASVYGFFFLSGYWVARLWEEKYAAACAPLATFYISRAWRIYPLAIVSTLFVYLVADAAWDKLILSLVLVYAHKVAQPLNAAAWSLAIELQFYALAPFLFVALCNRLAAVAILLVGAGMWAAFVFGDFGVTITLANFITLFVLGILYAWYPRHDIARRLAPYSLLAVAVLGLLTSLPVVRSLLPTLASVSSIRMFAVLLGLLALPYIAASLSKTSDKSDRVLGDLAYPLFLFHLPAAWLMWTFGTGATVAVAITMTIAAYVLIDRPSEAARQTFVKSRMRGSLGAL